MSNNTFDYAESDDWVWGYGYTQKDNEYAIHISGGGCPNTPNGWEDWVIKGDECELLYYIRHGGSIPDKLQVGKKLVSCPDGNYISWKDNDYKLKEGEMDFEWLEDEFNLKPKRTQEGVLSKAQQEKKDLEKANVFLKNIAEAQTKKIEELQEANTEQDDFEKSVRELVGTPIIPNIEKLQEKVEELIDELECRKSYYDTKIGELEAFNEELEEKYSKAVQDVNQRAWREDNIKKYLSNSCDYSIERSTICDWYGWTDKDFQEESSEEEEDEDKARRIERLCKEHNITKEEFAECVKESSDYDIKDFEKYLLILELEKQQKLLEEKTTKE